MFSKHQLIAIISSIVTLALLLIIPATVFAGGSDTGDCDDKDKVVKPKIELENDNYLIISYHKKVDDKVAVAQKLNAYLESALDKMNSSYGGKYTLLSGSNSMTNTVIYYPNQQYYNSYVSGQFKTYVSWTNSPADFWGTSSAAWYGTVPMYNCDVISTEHEVFGEEYYCWVQQPVPSGWTYLINSAYSGVYLVSNTWYLGTSWSGLRISYPSSPTVLSWQNTTNAFDFGRPDDPVLYPSASMYFGY